MTMCDNEKILDSVETRLSEEDIKKQSNDVVPDTFCFESDHLSLKGNQDYYDIINTKARLLAQRTKAIKDIETLQNLKNEALNAPIEFVEKIKRKEDLGMPKPQNIVEIPTIDWGKYASSLNFKVNYEQNSRTRCKANENALDSSTSMITSVKSQQENDKNRSETYNKSWTKEEQKKLEELLIKYPPELVESKRWRKIAGELKNRTSIQVASRVQKYFIKMARVGLPVPGRFPNIPQSTRNNVSNRYHKLIGSYRYHPSTFFASYAPPVLMPADDEFEEQQPCSSNTRYCDSPLEDSLDFGINERNIPEELRNTPEFKELMELKRAKAEIIERRGAHYGYKCDICSEEPIVGQRFHCSDCHPSVDFCSLCYSRVKENNIHNPHHNFDVIDSRPTAQFADPDYKKFSFIGPNYLDPNFSAKT